MMGDDSVSRSGHGQPELNPEDPTHAILVPSDTIDSKTGTLARLGKFYTRQRAEVRFIGGFIALIVLGTILLLLPPATPEDHPISLVDALFTSTSATCVTGLVVRDTGTGFTHFGQCVILALIQIGGIGIMTISAFFLFIVGQRVSFHSGASLENVFRAHEKRGVRKLVVGIILITLVVESIGAVCLRTIMADAGSQDITFDALFHSVSATCNAGFSLYPDSLARFRGHAALNLTMMALIILGGIGFSVIFDLVRSVRTSDPVKRRLSLHTRIVLTTTGVLLAVGFAVFFLFESGRTMADLPVGDRIWSSAFQSVTLRTAGFNTLDFGDMRPATLFLVLLFMFVGGSPGSTAGGVKTTTFAIALFSIWARARGRPRVSIFKRQIPEVLCTRALLIFLLSFLLLSLALVLLMLTEAQHLEGSHGREGFLDLLFEAVSAFGTVGLSTGRTPGLSDGGRLIICALMFIGRIGPLTLATAVGPERGASSVQYPEGRVMIG